MNFNDAVTRIWSWNDYCKILHLSGFGILVYCNWIFVYYSLQRKLHNSLWLHWEGWIQIVKIGQFLFCDFVLDQWFSEVITMILQNLDYNQRWVSWSFNYPTSSFKTSMLVFEQFDILRLDITEYFCSRRTSCAVLFSSTLQNFQD